MSIVTRYICQNCGSVSPKWLGKCEECGLWNTLIEETMSKQQAKAHKTSMHGIDLIPLMSAQPHVAHERLISGITEFDRVCGGGIVPGSVILVGGDPGIGKSTLLLQVIAALGQHTTTAYISGEENVAQVQLRAERLGLTAAKVLIAAHANMQEIMQAVSANKVKAFVIDSIQTMHSSTIDGLPGMVNQVRTVAQELIQFAKLHAVAVVIIGHVTKEGAIAGPRLLEHMVDTVLYFEGERSFTFRILRSVKNRFGATDEVGIFDMTQLGLQEVKNPSALFLEQHKKAVPGSCIFAGVEGSRPLLIEIQSLVSASFLPTPRRTVIGWDPNRLAMILAVLESYCKLPFPKKDVFLSVIGGIKINEPFADLAVVLSLLSSIKQKPLQAVAFGEVGLTGEIRHSVKLFDLRLKEAKKFGFTYIALPCRKNRSDSNPPSQQRITAGNAGNVENAGNAGNAGNVADSATAVRNKTTATDIRDNALAADVRHNAAADTDNTAANTDNTADILSFSHITQVVQWIDKV